MFDKFDKEVIITVFGASGDLAKKKTLPALFGLFRENELPETFRIFGFARSKLSNEDFHQKFAGNLKVSKEEQRGKIDEFLSKTEYFQGNYVDEESFKKFEAKLQEFEKANGITSPKRIYYFALPPSSFIDVATNLSKFNKPKNGNVRLIIEKPFGRDLDSCRSLINSLQPLFKEEEMFRIDHYLGKEIVKNLLILRFSNEIFNTLWNAKHIKSIQIIFKEKFGTEGRGGYFDGIGIIRDVMQNHLLQILTLLTCEKPKNFTSEYIRDAKVKLLEQIEPLNPKDILVGQYTKSRDGTKPGYLDDETVNPSSKALTFAAIVLKIKNEQWKDVPIVMRAGKALNESKVEVRIQFHKNTSVDENHIYNNELVIRVQPSPAIYLKINNKVPGLSNKINIVDLDLNYDTRFDKKFWIPEAYESLIRDVIHGESSNFVRSDELDVSWRLFTPLLQYLESPKNFNSFNLIPYAYGDRTIEGLDDFLEAHGYKVQNRDAYQWPVTKLNILEKI